MSKKPSRRERKRGVRPKPKGKGRKNPALTLPPGFNPPPIFSPLTGDVAESIICSMLGMGIAQMFRPIVRKMLRENPPEEPCADVAELERLAALEPEEGEPKS